MEIEDLKNWNPKPLPELECATPRDWGQYSKFRTVMDNHFTSGLSKEYTDIARMGHGHPEEHECIWRTKPYAALGIRFIPKPGSCFFDLSPNDARRYWSETAVTLGKSMIACYVLGKRSDTKGINDEYWALFDSVKNIVIRHYYPRGHKIPKSWFYHAADYVLREVANLTGANRTIKELNGMFTWGPSE